MWGLALKYWQPLAGFAAGATVAALLGWATHTILSNWQAAEYDKKLAAQAQAAEDKLAAVSAGLVAKCQKDNQINMEVSREYQKRLADRDTLLNRLREQAARASCIPVTLPTVGPAAAGFNGGAGAGEHGGANGLNPLPLVDFAGRCEQYRAQTLGLQDFIRREREADPSPTAPLPERRCSLLKPWLCL